MAVWGLLKLARPRHAIPITPSLACFLEEPERAGGGLLLYSEAEGAVRGSWRAVFTAQSSHRGCHMAQRAALGAGTGIPQQMSSFAPGASSGPAGSSVCRTAPP